MLKHPGHYLLQQLGSHHAGYAIEVTFRIVFYQISTDDSKVAVWVIPTNEELVVAREIKRLLDNPAPTGIRPKQP